MIRRVCLLLPVALALTGCGGGPNEKRYQFDGTIVAVGAASKSATIKAGKIGDWMEPMTMEYLIKPDSELAKIHAGDKIKATAVVKDPSYYVTDITVVH